jgi:hypothetical protein
MGILNLIRQQSDGQKKIVSLVTAVILTLIIVFVWYSFSNSNGSEELAVNEPSKLSSISPVQMIKDEFSKAFSNFKETTEQLDLSTTTESTSTVPIVPIEIIEATSTATTTN